MLSIYTSYQQHTMPVSLVQVWNSHTRQHGPSVRCVGCGSVRHCLKSIRNLDSTVCGVPVPVPVPCLNSQQQGAVCTSTPTCRAIEPCSPGLLPFLTSNNEIPSNPSSFVPSNHHHTYNSERLLKHSYSLLISYTEFLLPPILPPMYKFLVQSGVLHAHL